MTALAKWYMCGGCGPSLRCMVCKATECSQDPMDASRCPGCAKALKMRAGTIPWNVRLHCTKERYEETTIPGEPGEEPLVMTTLVERVRPRPVRHMRKWWTKRQRHHKRLDREGWHSTFPNRYKKPDHRPGHVKQWDQNRPVR